MHGLPTATKTVNAEPVAEIPSRSRSLRQRRIHVKERLAAFAKQRSRAAWNALLIRVGIRKPIVIAPPPHPLDATPVRDLMVPRALLTMVNVDDDAAEVRAAMREVPSGRLPVLDVDDERVLGLIAVADLDLDAVGAWSAKIRDVPYLFEAASARIALTTLRGARSRDAAVLDEHGGLVGWLSDIQLRDVSPAAMKLLDGSSVDGTFSVRLLADALSLEIECHSSSVGGLLTERLGHFAQAGESTELPGWTLEVVEANPMRVLSVRLVAHPEPDLEDALPA